MKNNFKIILLFVWVFLIIGCGSKKYTFEDGIISIKSNIKENHQVFDNKKVKLEGMYCLANSDDLKRMKDNFSIRFKDNNLKKYNFIISFSKESILESTYFYSDTLFFKEEKILRVSYMSKEEIISYLHEKKIKNGFVHFGCTQNSEIDLNFLLQKFNEIDIIEKKPLFK